MNPNQPTAYSVPSPDRGYEYNTHRHFCRSVSWPAIIAGIAAAMAIQVLFMLLGAGLGFAIYSPLTDENPIANLGRGAIIIQGVSAVLSLWFGGWVAGRFTPVAIRASAWLHGFIVWCSATVAGVLIVSTGAGWAVGDLSKIVGGGLSLAGRPAAAAVGSAGDMAKDALKKSTDTIGSFVDEAASTRPQGATAATSIRAKREISMAAGRFFNPVQPGNKEASKAALVKAIADNTGVSQADAEREVAQWTATYDQMKADLKAAKDQAEAKARQAADEAAKALAIFSLGAFVAFVIGAIAASCGGCHGAKCATQCENRESPPRAV